MDGFRAIAVLWIILHHIFVFFDLRPILGSLMVPFSKFAAVGVFGVDIFFVISGFLITGLLLEDFDNGKIRIRRFYMRRFLKIIPQYTLTVIAGLALTLVYHFGRNADYDPLHIIWINAVFIQNYCHSMQVPPLAHLWTIAVEEQFYFVYPLLLILICFIFKDTCQKRTALIIICLMLIVTENACRCAAIAEVFRKGGTFWYQETQFHSDGLALGVLIKLIEPYLSGIAGTLKQSLCFACLTAGMAIYLVFILNGVNFLSWPTLELACLAPGLLLLSALINEDGFIQYFAENKALRWVGKNSYGIYLWHYVLLFFILANFKHPDLLNAILAYYVAGTIFLGYLSTVTVEQYFLNFRKIFD